MEREQLVVVGAGVAGTSAAIEAAKAGLNVTLIDENPLETSMMGLDVPLMYGERFINTVRDRALMLERVVSTNDLLEQAADAGVDVQLGVNVWGSFKNEEHSYHHDAPVVGLANHEHSWVVEYERLILAAGSRDLAVAVPGWEAAGVMGAGGFFSLSNRYQALSARRIVVLGAGNLGLQVASIALDRGLEVAGVVDVAGSVAGDAILRSDVEAQNVPMFMGSTDLKVDTDGDEVSGLVVTGRSGNTQTLSCDTVVLAVGQVPTVDLAYITGCQMAFRPETGGWVPEVDHNMETSVPGVFVAGDAAGVTDAMLIEPSIAAAQGRIAAIAAARSLGAIEPEQADGMIAELTPAGAASPSDANGYRRDWFDAMLKSGGADMVACKCEEVTVGEVLDLSPPRYLSWKSEQMSARNLETLLNDGPINQDQVKRLTRAGMGYCQGRRCREQIAVLLSHGTNTPIAEVPLATYRAPLRPLPLKVIYDHEESQATRDTWSGWLHLPRARRMRGPVGPHHPGR